MIRNDNNIKIIQNIENEIIKKKQELNEKQKDYKNLENQALNLSKEKEKLLGEIKQYEEQILSKNKNIVNDNDNLNNRY